MLVCHPSKVEEGQLGEHRMPWEKREEEEVPGWDTSGYSVITTPSMLSLGWWELKPAVECKLTFFMDST